MIDKREILEAASSFSLLPNVVEKDYVLGWILAGINAHEDLAESWVFKGGTCLKKCYFETYRFSEDLDFSLRDENHLDEEFLKPVFEEVVAWVTEQSGLNIPADQLEFEIYDNPRGKPNCQGKIAYRGPVSPTSGGWPKVKLDLTADERLVLPSVRREVFHPYTDKPEGGIWANCYAYEEAFGEKLRALGERTRPRDLYDVVNLYIRSNSRIEATALGGKYEDLVGTNSISIRQYDKVVVCLDNVVSRYAVQSDLPRFLVNAGTNAYSFQASRHDFLTGPCLACLYPPRKGTSHEQRVACDQIAQGQSVRAMESYSMVTGLAGLYLLLQLLADRNWSPHHQGNALRLDSIIDEARKKDPECVLFCEEPQVQARFRENYSPEYLVQ